jgi:hypothetical protein
MAQLQQILSDAEKNIKGKEAEREFMKWLKRCQIPYFYFEQGVEVWSPDMDGAKRPDFMILLRHVGFLMVDVKHNNIKKEFDDILINCEEAEKSVELHQQFGFNMWYAMSNREFKYERWFWIPVSRLIRDKQEKNKSDKYPNKPFYKVPKKEFVVVESKESMIEFFKKVLGKNKN